jgi:CheY-like chemotaxis protein/CheY-specific phosphatase CheX
MAPKILSVDDNPIISFLVASALRPFDCIVCGATDGEEGLAAAIREKPDLIILDISMPVMDGIAMLAQLRQNPELASTPVIMLTAWSGQERVLQASELGVLDYLVKPFTKSQLIEKVGRIVHLASKSAAGATGRKSAAAAAAPPPSAAPSDPASPDQGKNYGLLIPENVIRLANLVTHQDVDLEEIAKVIGEDPELTSRLLRMANAKLFLGDSEITSVSGALVLNGIGCVFLLTMGDLVKRALLKTFQTMLGIKLETVNPAKFKFPTGIHVLSEVEFTGKAMGSIHMHLDQKATGLIVSRLLGLDAADPATHDQIADAICELTNIVGGNFLSNLADAGLTSRLSSPKVSHTAHFRVNTVWGGLSERLAFDSSEISVLLDISINPWNE